MSVTGATAKARRAGGAALTALALAAAGCARPAADAWPEGAVLSGRRDALERVLSRLGQLERTPLGREAAAWRAALPACEEVEARAPEASLASLRADLRCADAHGPLAAVHRARGERDLLFAWPLAGARARGSAVVSDGGDVDLRLELPAGVFDGARALLRPGDTSAGPPVLGGSGALVHARLRPADGIDLPALVESGGQADALFALKSRLFGAAVLDGTWELALYAPGPGESTPRVALALGTRDRAIAAAAADAFLDDLEARWPLRRQPFSHGSASGACLPELRVLPDLSPCWVATERALVVAWNAESLRQALEGPAGDLPPGGGLVAELASLPAADARLAAPAADGGVQRWPWRRLVAEPVRGGSEVELHLALAGASGA